MQEELLQAILSLCDVIINDENMNCRIAPNDTITYRLKAMRVKYLALNAIDEQARQGLAED